jgi:hypothetical protein
MSPRAFLPANSATRTEPVNSHSNACHVSLICTQWSKYSRINFQYLDDNATVIISKGHKRSSQKFNVFNFGAGNPYSGLDRACQRTAWLYVP